MNLRNLILGNIEQEDLLSYYNARYYYVDFPDISIRGLVDYYKGFYYIYINKNLSYYKRKKTLLHELAHIELNQLGQKDNDLFAFHINKYEDEADRYLKWLESIKEEGEVN